MYGTEGTEMVDGMQLACVLSCTPPIIPLEHLSMCGLLADAGGKGIVTESARWPSELPELVTGLLYLLRSILSSRSHLPLRESVLAQ